MPRSLGRDLSGLRMPYIWLDATYVKCRTGSHVASVAVVTAIGCDEDGWRRVLGLDVDTESYDSWLGFLQGLRARGVHGVELVTSDAHTGLKRAISEVFQGAAWQRCVVHLIGSCAREAGAGASPGGSPGSWRRSSGPRTPGTVRAMYHVACEMLEACCPRAAALLEEAEPDALAYLDFPRTTGRGSGPTTSKNGPTEIAPQPRRSGVPLGEVPAQAGGSGDVRPGRGLVGGQVLLRSQDGGAAR